MVEALIVGAGPTGLTLGCELIKKGLDVRLIEQLSTPTDQSRALALQARTLEVFEKMGILEEFLKKGLIVRHANIYYKRKQVAGIDFSHLVAPHPFILIVPQSQTEKILADHFTKLGGKIERGSALKDLKGVQARLAHADQREEIISPTWIFACDGAHSTVRHCLDLPFKGAKLPEHFALADVETSSSLIHDQAHILLMPDSDAALLPLPSQNWFRLIILNQKNNSGESTALTLPLFQSYLDKVAPAPVKLIQSNWMTVFAVHRRITPKMRVGNVFLLGDASHIHSPFGGQGLNTSVQDAFNLAWKIALVRDGIGNEILLDSFEKERHPVAKSVLRGTTAGTKIISSNFLKRLAVPLIRHFSKGASFQRSFVYQISEIDIAYPKSPIIAYSPCDKKWEGPLPGQRAPDALLPENKRLFDLLCHPQHTLLCFGEKELDPFIEPITSRFSKILRAVRLAPNQSGEASSAYRTASPCFYLIRPDGIIAYRSRSLDPAPLLSYLSKLFKI